MRKYIFILLAMLAVTGCRYSFDLETYGLEPRLAIRATISADDSVSVLIHKALPINEIGKSDTELENAAVVLKCNGQEVETSSYRQDKTGFRFDTKAFRSGDKIEIIAGADGIQTATAATTIPGVFPDHSIELKHVEDNVRRLLISYEDDPETEDYYGVAIYSRIINKDAPDVVYPESTISPLNDWDSLHIDPNSYSPVYDYWNGEGIFIWKDEDEADNVYEVLFQHNSNSPSIRERHIRCRLYKLSEEMYRTIFADYDASYNPLAYMGLSSPSFTYTNICDGVGWFCSYTDTYSDWIIDDKEDR